MGIKYIFNPITGSLDAVSVETPAGADTEIQFNNAGVFGADSDLTWDDTSTPKVLSVGGVISPALGTAAAPSIAFTGDPNTGIFSPGADQLAVATNGTQRLHIDSNGNIGFNVAAGGQSGFGGFVKYKGSPSPGLFLENGATTSWFGIYGGTGTGDSAALIYPSTGSLRIATSTDVGVGGFVERLRIDSSGRLLVGTSSARSNFFNTTYTPQLQLEGVGQQQSFFSLTNSVADNGGPVIGLAKQRSGSIGGNTIVNSGDNVGQIDFFGSDGTEMVALAEISAFVDGIPGANDMPGRLVFFTTADGASSPTERLRIDSSGNVGIGTTSPEELLHIFDGGTAVNQAIKFGSPAASAYGLIKYSASGTEFLDLSCKGTTTNYGNIRFYTGAVPDERARIDSSGRLLVGTSSGSNLVQIDTGTLGTSGDGTTGAIYHITRRNGTVLSLALEDRGAGDTATPNGAGTQIGFYGYTGSDKSLMGLIACQADGQAIATGDGPGRLVFSTTADGASTPTERVRIKSDGVTSFGQAATGPGAGVAGTLINAGDGGILITNNTEPFLRCYTFTGGFPNALQIAANGNVTNANNSYGAISDIKLKENIVDANSQWDDLKALRVRNYNLKEGRTHTQIGLVAQEVELVSPGLVNESPDRDEDGNDLGTTTKSVNYSVLYMKAVKALQEAMERIETLEASNTDLLARVTALESA